MAGKDLFAPASEAKAKGKDLFAGSQPASPFLQRGMGMVQGAMATPPRQPAAWEAGAREYVANMPERERGGIQSGGDAALFNIANTLTAGGLQRAGNQVVPGKNLGDAAMREGESYYPTASVVGRGLGYAAPAGAGGRVANMAVQDLITASGARNLVPKAISEGTDALARTARYTGRLGTLAPVGALQTGAFEGIVEQPVRDFMAGEESTVGGRVRAGVNALANPINYGVLPAASLVGRLGKSVVTGVATPGDVQRAVTSGSRGAVPLSEGQLAADAAQILDTQAMSAIGPRGFKLVERILRQSGLSDSDIPAVNAKVRELLKAAPDAVAGRLTLGQVYAKALYDLDKTQAGENILKVLRERRNVTDVGDRSPSIVGKEVRDLRGSQVDFVTQSAESNLGAGKRIDIKNAVAETKKQIGAEYNRVLAEADPTRPEARGIAMIVMGDASAPGILKRRAENAGFESVEAYVANRPDEAGHWLRSSLAKAARGASGREKIELETTVGQLDELLDTNAGYAQARQQYGTEIGVDEARDIGSNFIAASRNQGNLDLLLEQIAALPPRQRDVALLSIRDNLLSPVRGSGEDAPARISQLVSVGTLEGLERLGPAGKGLADDIRAIRDENNFLGQIDSGNPLRQSATFSNADAAANAPDLYSGGIARTLNAGGGSSLPADIAISAITGTPIAPFTLAKIARGGLQSVFAPGRKSKEAMTQFLMTRPRNALPSGTPPAGAPPPQAPPPLTTGAPAMAAPAGAPVPPPKPPGKLGTRIADSAAIATLGLQGGTAEADTGGTEQARLSELAQLETAAQQQIATFDQSLKAFEALPPIEKQRFLKDNGFVGKDGKVLVLDGGTGDNTTFAIKAYKKELGDALAAQKAERDSFREETNTIRVSLANQDNDPANPWLDKGLELGAYGAALYGAHRFRGAGLKSSAKNARAVEDKANALLTRLPVPPDVPAKTLLSRVPIIGNKERARIATETKAATKAGKAVEDRLSGKTVPPISPDPTSPDGLPTRIENLQQFYRQGGAEGKLPLEDLGNGQFAPRIDAMPDYRLYGPKGPIGRFMEPVTSRFRTGDAAVMGAGATDAVVMEGMLEKTRSDIAEEEVRLQKAQEANKGAGDATRIRASRDRLKELRTIETGLTTAQRIGIGLFAGGALGVAHGKYARPEPRFEAAGRERQLINQAISPAPIAPPPVGPVLTAAPPAPPPPLKKPRTRQPKPKPPVAITSGKRPPKPNNDND
jgi:hypothetical protein